MEFRILGPLEITGPGGSVELGSAKLRSVLVLLLIHADEVVSAERLIDDLWEGAPPRSATATLQTYISQLRKQLGPAVVQSVSGGYRFNLEGHRLDAVEFETELDNRAQSRADPASDTERLRAALDLWRGAALADLPGAHWATAEAARLEGLRQIAAQDLVEARLALGEHARLVPELEAAVAANPLQERPWAQLMLALYRCGRQADALRAYGRLRTHLGEELGIEPSTELAQLEQAILLQKTELDWRPEGQLTAVAPIADRTPPSGVVTFLLTDIVGSTALWDQYPGEMSEAIAAHGEVILEAVRGHDGRLLKQRGEGDSTFSVFALATDAVDAAIRMQRALRALSWPDGVDLGVRAGLHSGEAVERDGDYYGTTVNRAARLRALAGGGEILVSQATAELVLDHLAADVELLELGVQALAGLRRHEHVFQIQAPGVSTRAGAQPLRSNRGATSTSASGTTPMPLPAALARAEGVFAGRESELETLTTAWKATQAGSRRVVLVGGEPGIGKTRLAAELAARVRDDGGVVLLGRCEDGFGAPFKPFVEALSDLLITTNPVELASWVHQHGADLAPVVRVVRQLFPQVGDPEPTDPETARLRLCEAIDALIAAVTRTEPLLLVLDDLHWADNASVLLLRYLTRSSRPASVLIVVTFRESDIRRDGPMADVLADLRREPAYEGMMLAGLDASGTTALVLAAEADPRPEFIAALQRETEGNPFFIEEVLANLRETGMVVETDDRSAFDRPMSDLGIPAGVRDLIDRRVARLSEPTQRLLSVAAVIGREFDLDLLGAIVPSDDDVLLDQLDEAVETGLVEEYPDASGRFAFSHALVRATVADGLGPNRRVSLHHRIGEALEVRYADNVDEHVAELAYHFVKASRVSPEKAAQYAVVAAGRVFRSGSDHEALAGYELARDLIAAMPEPDRALRCRALIGLANVLGALDPPRAWAPLEEALVLALQLGSAHLIAEASRSLPRLVAPGQSVPRIRAILDEASHLRGADDATQALLLALSAWMTIDSQPTEPQARDAERDVRKAIEFSQRSGDAEAIEYTWSALYEVLEWGPDVSELLDAAQRSAGHRRTSAQWREATCRIRMGDRLGCETLLAELAAFYAEHPVALDSASRARYEAVFAMAEGRWNDATDRSDEARAHMPTPSFELVNFAQRLRIRIETGRADAAQLARLAEEWSAVPSMRAEAGIAAAEAGDLETARAVFDSLATDDFATLPYDFARPIMLREVAELCAYVGTPEQAATLHAILAPYDRQILLAFKGTSIEGAAARCLAQLETVLGWYDEAEAHFEAAIALEDSIGGRALIPRTQYWYGAMLVDRDGAGDRARADDLLASSRAVALELGMARLAEQAEAKLIASR